MLSSNGVLAPQIVGQDYSYISINLFDYDRKKKVY